MHRQTGPPVGRASDDHTSTQQSKPQRSPLFSSDAIALIAAMPDAKANPVVPPSIAVRLASSAARVGFWVRAYSNPCAPERILDVGGCLIDRRDDGPGRRVRFLAGVQTNRLEPCIRFQLHDGLTIHGLISRSPRA